MPLTSTGKRVLAEMQSQYGKDRGTQVFHSSINKEAKGSEQWHNPGVARPRKGIRRATNTLRKTNLNLALRGELTSPKGEELGFFSPTPPGRTARRRIPSPVSRDDYPARIAQRQKAVGRTGKIMKRALRRARWRQVGR